MIGRRIGLVLLWALSACATPEAQKTGAELLLKGMNSHRMFLTQGMLHEEIVVFDDGGEIARGLEAVHSWLAWDSTLARKISYDSLAVSGDTTWIHGAWLSGVDLALLGFTEVPLSTGSFMVHAWGGVRELHLSARLPTPSGDPADLEADFRSWAAEEHPQRLSSIWAQERYLYSKSGAAELVALLREWVTRER